MYLYSGGCCSGLCGERVACSARLVRVHVRWRGACITQIVSFPLSFVILLCAHRGSSLFSFVHVAIWRCVCPWVGVYSKFESLQNAQLYLLRLLRSRQVLALKKLEKRATVDRIPHIYKNIFYLPLVAPGRLGRREWTHLSAAALRGTELESLKLKISLNFC